MIGGVLNLLFAFTVSRIEVLQGGCYVEGSSSPKCGGAVRRDDVRVSVCDGIGVDDDG